jgi:hypothetical protein
MVYYVMQAMMGAPRMSLWLDKNQTDFITHVPDHLALRVLSAWSNQHMVTCLQWMAANILGMGSSPTSCATDVPGGAAVMG